MRCTEYKKSPDFEFQKINPKPEEGINEFSAENIAVEVVQLVFLVSFSQCPQPQT